MMQVPTSGKWIAGALLVSALLVWSRDTSWLSSIADTLPLAAGMPLALWLGAPWQVLANSPGKKIHTILLGLGFLLFAVGWILPSITLLAVAWTVFAGYGIIRWWKPDADPLGLLVVLLFSFPWMVLEWPQIGWWFRLSAAASTEGFFHLLQMPVERNGTELMILGEIVRIEPACAGWNLLQLTLLVGVSIGLHDLSKRQRFFCFLLFLPLLAWLANFFRIVILSVICLSFGVVTAEGVWHALTGLLVICTVILMAKLLCVLIEPRAAVLIRHMKKP